MDFYIALDEKKLNYSDTLSYYWYKSQKIHATQGMSAGELLHGNFLKYHTDGQLAEQGLFKYGLKHGLWMTWYENGKIKSRQTYKNGVLKGRFTFYNEDGSVKKSGKYKKGIENVKPVDDVKINEDDNEVEENEGDDRTFFERLLGIDPNEEDDPEKIAKKLEKIKKKEERKKAREAKKAE